MQKIRYELDPYNRLVRSGLHKFRQVLDGRFRTDDNNELSYHIKAPLSGAEKIPHQLRLKGAWSLTDDHTLRLTLDKSGRETFGDKLTLEGDIVDVRENALLFAVSTASKDNARSTYVLALGGSWKADERNRLSFHIKKEGGRVDILTFTGTWELDKDHQIIYQYEKARLVRKKSQTHTLTFRGYWQIRDNSNISYELSGNTDSVFEFNTGIAVFKEDYIQYKLMVGLTDRKNPALRTIKFSGVWNLKKGSGLVFEIEYENGKAVAAVFGVDFAFTDKGTVSFKLRDAADSRDLGISLELSRKILKGDGEAFLRMSASGRGSGVYAGAAWRW